MWANNSGINNNAPTLSQIIGVDLQGMLNDIHKIRSSIDQRLDVMKTDSVDNSANTALLPPPEPWAQWGQDPQYRPRGYTPKNLQKLSFKELFELFEGLDALRQKQISLGLLTVATNFSMEVVSQAISYYKHVK